MTRTPATAGTTRYADQTPVVEGDRVRCGLADATGVVVTVYPVPAGAGAMHHGQAVVNWTDGELSGMHAHGAYYLHRIADAAQVTA